MTGGCWTIERPLRPPSLSFLWAAGTVLLFLAYAAIFAAFWPGGPVAAALLAALTNVAPLAVLAAVLRAVLKTYVMPHGVGWQGAAHSALAPAFAVTWYGAVIVLQALLGLGGGAAGVRLIGFSPVALVWQAFQGLVLYALVAAICYAVRGGREAAPVSFVDAPPPLDRYLIRRGDELVPIRVGEVAAITGAQDYSEVTTADGRRHPRPRARRRSPGSAFPASLPRPCAAVPGSVCGHELGGQPRGCCAGAVAWGRGRCGGGGDTAVAFERCETRPSCAYRAAGSLALKRPSRRPWALLQVAVRTSALRMPWIFSECLVLGPNGCNPADTRCRTAEI